LLQSVFATLSFANTSVASDCNNILVSEVSRELFKGVEKQTLSANFVNFNSFLFYAVKNANGANIGVVVSDGIVVNFGTSPVQSVDICVTVNNDLQLPASGYPVMDFASR
jgi:hypothetical protein